MSASITSQQAFNSATGQSMDDLSVTIKSLVAIILILWVCWIVLAHYKQWADGQATIDTILFAAIRSSIVASLIFWMF